MIRAMLFIVCVFSAMTPGPALAQSYQQYSDGLVSVTAKRVLESDGRVGFIVCAQLMRQEAIGPLHIRLNLWGTAGGFAGQMSFVLHPEIAAPVCQQLPVPLGAGTVWRWEVARFHFLETPTPHRAGRFNHAG